MIPTWAQRISDLLDADASKSAMGLARACGVQRGSISGWFGKGKPTKMISGDNLVAAAAYLGVTPEFIMTGRNRAVLSQSQPLRIDPATISETIRLLRERDELRDWLTVIQDDPELFVKAYEVYAEQTTDDPSNEQQRKLGMKIADLTPQEVSINHERVEAVPSAGDTERIMGKGRKRKT